MSILIIFLMFIFPCLIITYRPWFCCGSLLPVFGFRVSVTFHLIFVHIIFSSVLVGCLVATFWERAAHSVDHMFSLYFDFHL